MEPAARRTVGGGDERVEEHVAIDTTVEQRTKLVGPHRVPATNALDQLGDRVHQKVTARPKCPPPGCGTMIGVIATLSFESRPAR